MISDLLIGLLVPGRQRYDLEEVVLQIIHMLESTFDLGVTVYLVKPVHKKLNMTETLGLKRHAANRAMIFDRSLFRCSNVNGELSAQTIAEELTGEEKSSDRNVAFLGAMAQLCRHGYLLQAYRGYHSLAGYDWTVFGDVKNDSEDNSNHRVDDEEMASPEHKAGVLAGVANIEACARGDRVRALSQTCLVPLLDAGHVLDALEPAKPHIPDRNDDLSRAIIEGVDDEEVADLVAEGPVAEDTAQGEVGICEFISQVAKKECMMGNYVIPLIAYDAMCVGMVVLSGADKIPHSIYETLVLKSGQSLVDNPRSNKFKVHNEEAMREKWDKVYREEPEEGVASSLVASGKLMGALLAQAAVDMAVKEMKMFFIREETPLLDVLRFCFRCIANAFPVITGLSVWGVDSLRRKNKRTKRNISVEVFGSDAKNKSRVQSKEKIAKAGAVSPLNLEAADEDCEEESIDDDEVITDQNNNSIGISNSAPKCLLKVGYFGMQDVLDLVVSSPDERLIERLQDSVAAPVAQKSTRRTLVGVASNVEKERQRLRRSMAHIASIGGGGDDRWAPLKAAAADKMYEEICPWTLSSPDFVALPKNKYTSRSNSGNIYNAYNINENFQGLLQDEILKCLKQHEKTCFRVSSGHDLVQLLAKRTIAKDKNKKAPKVVAVKDTAETLVDDAAIVTDSLNAQNEKEGSSGVSEIISLADRRLLYDILDDLFGVPKASRLTPRTKAKIKVREYELALAVNQEDDEKNKVPESSESAVAPQEPVISIEGIPKPTSAPPKKKPSMPGGMSRARSTMRKNREQQQNGAPTGKNVQKNGAIGENADKVVDKESEDTENRRHKYFLAVSTIGGDVDKF